MSIIKRVAYDITTINTNGNMTKSKKYIAIKLIINSEDYKEHSIIMCPPRMFDPNGEELVCTNCNNIVTANRHLSYSIGSLNFKYVLGNEKSFLDAGYKLVIEYRCHNKNVMLKEIWIWDKSINEWKSADS